MGLSLRIENETRLPDGGPLTYRLAGKRGADIGRDPHLDWTLPDPTRYISGKHCEIRYRDGGYWLYDVSTNGTILNDGAGRMQSPHLLHDGDRLTIGNYIIVVEVDAAAVAETAPVPPEHQDIWEGADDAAPPLDRKEFKPAAELGPVRPDFLEWAVDVPDSPSSGFALRPASAAVPQPRQDRDDDVDWAGATSPAPPATTEPAPPLPNPRRPVWKAEPASSFGDRAAAPRERATAQERATEEHPESRAEAPPQSGSFPPDSEASLASTEFLRAFAKGASLPENALVRLAPGEFAEWLGRLMLLVVENVKELLNARLQAKRLGRSSDLTMIQALNNNPLKFSPSSADALRIMFGPQTKSYLESGLALQESFDDLKTHQIKTFSAMQSALKALLNDLDPLAIERDLDPDSGIGALIGSRKARLWDAYTARWQAKTRRQADGILQAFMLLFAEYYDLANEDEKR